MADDSHSSSDEEEMHLEDVESSVNDKPMELEIQTF